RDTQRVALECDPRLAGLFARSFPGVEIVRSGSLSPLQMRAFDHLLPAGSLGRLYRRSIAEFPASDSYLKPDEAIVAERRRRLSCLGGGPKVGISWRGGTETTRRDTRSIPLTRLRPLLELEGVHFVSLQYGNAGTEIDRANETLPHPINHFP